MSTDSDLIRTDLDYHEHITATEQITSIVEFIVHDHMVSLHTLQMNVKSLEVRVEVAESTAGATNLCILGLP